MSQLADTCNAIIALLEDADGLAGAVEHRFAPWSVENLFTSVNERHIAVWPVADVETAVGLATGSHELEQVFEVLVWEDASEEGTRRMDNEAANLEWLELYERVRGLYYHDNRQTLGGGNVSLTWFIGGEFGTQGSVRWFRQRVKANVFMPFTA